MRGVLVGFGGSFLGLGHFCISRVRRLVGVYAVRVRRLVVRNCLDHKTLAVIV